MISFPLNLSVASLDLDDATFLTALLAIDGSGSGLDADLLDGLNASATLVVSTIMSRDANGDSALRALTLTGGTVTASTPTIAATQTWNSGGATFFGWTLDVTDTAAAAASRVFRIRGGTAATTVLMSVTKDGAATLRGPVTVGSSVGVASTG